MDVNTVEVGGNEFRRNSPSQQDASLPVNIVRINGEEFGQMTEPQKRNPPALPVKVRQ
jgi:hypothetical protein